MRHILSAVFCLLVIQFNAISQTCLPGGITFSTQLDVDLFPTVYPNCTTIGGRVTIQGSNITNLDSLISIQKIESDLYITSTDLSDLSGLNFLESIQGEFYFGSNDALTNFVGLDKLKHIGGLFTVIYNGGLTNFTGLDSLTFIGETFEVSGNFSLENFIGLSHLDSLPSTFLVMDNQNLINFNGLTSLTIMEDNLDIFMNSSLQSLDGLNQLTKLRFLGIFENNSLTDLSSLSALTEMYGLDVSYNISLASLNGLDSVMSPGHSVDLRDNDSLSDISAMELWDLSGLLGLTIQDNPKLNTCSYTSICSYVDQGGNASISNNNPGCNGINEINLACCLMDTAYCPEPSPTCLPNGITFSTQSEIDLFPLLYPDCQRIGGTVYINGNGITHIDSLYTIKIIEGDLRVTSTSITNFSGLNLLDSIQGEFSVSSNSSLSNFIGLDNLSSIGGYFSVQYNSGLQHFMGLDSLATIEENFEVTSNNHLQNFLGLNQLHTLSATFSVMDNQRLVDFDGLTSLTTIEDNFDIFTNDSLQSLNGLAQLNTVRFLSIYDNNKLDDLTSLIALTDVYGLDISENGSLESLAGLDSIESLGHTCYIRDNLLLSNISALEHMDFSGLLGLTIDGNPELSICNQIGVCQFLDQGGNATITSNKSGCNGINEVNIACCLLDTTFCPEPSANCLPNGITFTSQAEVDLFPRFYPGCRHIGGDVNISGNGITHLDSLYSIEIVSGDLRVYSTSIANFTGLNSLDSIQGEFYVSSNSSLNNFIGLHKLSIISEFFTVQYNSILQNFIGLDSLAIIGDNFEVNSNNSLQNFSGLTQLHTISATFLVMDNQDLINFNGLSSLVSIEDNFDIFMNDSLQSLDGLGQLNSVRFLSIYGNSKLDDLTALIAIKDAYGIDISENASLTTLSGLDSIQSPGHTIYIRDNANLDDISALEHMNLSALLGLTIQNNPQLATCSQSSICAYLNLGGDAIIAINSVGCRGNAEVLLDCNDLLFVFIANNGFWHAPLNWSSSAIPDSASFVIIPNGTDCEIQPDTVANCNFIHIEPSAQFFVPASSVLNVFGN